MKGLIKRGGKVKMHICLSVKDNCKNIEESYGEICVRCNKCGRFNKNK